VRARIVLRARQPRSWTNEYVRHGNETCSPFVWTKGPERLHHIIEKARVYQAGIHGNRGIAIGKILIKITNFTMC